MTRRVSIVLPESTLRTINGIAGHGQRNQFIDHAVQHFLASRSAETLRTRLEHAAVRDRDLDHAIVAEWTEAD